MIWHNVLGLPMSSYHVFPLLKYYLTHVYSNSPKGEMGVTGEGRVLRIWASLSQSMKHQTLPSFPQLEASKGGFEQLTGRTSFLCPCWLLLLAGALRM